MHKVFGNILKTVDLDHAKKSIQILIEFDEFYKIHFKKDWKYFKRVQSRGRKSDLIQHN